MSTALFIEVVERPLSWFLTTRTSREDDRVTRSDLSLGSQVPSSMDEVRLAEDAKSTRVLVATKTNEVQHLHLHNKKGLGDFRLRGPGSLSASKRHIKMQCLQYLPTYSAGGM